MADCGLRPRQHLHEGLVWSSRTGHNRCQAEGALACGRRCSSVAATV